MCCWTLGGWISEFDYGMGMDRVVGLLCQLKSISLREQWEDVTSGWKTQSDVGPG